MFYRDLVIWLIRKRKEVGLGGILPNFQPPPSAPRNYPFDYIPPSLAAAKNQVYIVWHDGVSPVLVIGQDLTGQSWKGPFSSPTTSNSLRDYFGGVIRLGDRLYLYTIPDPAFQSATGAYVRQYIWDNKAGAWSPTRTLMTLLHGQDVGVQSDQFGSIFPFRSDDDKAAGLTWTQHVLKNQVRSPGGTDVDSDAGSVWTWTTCSELCIGDPFGPCFASYVLGKAGSTHSNAITRCCSINCPGCTACTGGQGTGTLVNTNLHANWNNFGFTIPREALITGVEVRASAKYIPTNVGTAVRYWVPVPADCSDPQGRNSYVPVFDSIIMPGPGAVINISSGGPGPAGIYGNAKALQNGSVTYGSPSDNWSLSQSPSDFNSSTFTVSMAFPNGGAMWASDKSPVTQQRSNANCGDISCQDIGDCSCPCATCRGFQGETFCLNHPNTFLCYGGGFGCAVDPGLSNGAVPGDLQLQLFTVTVYYLLPGGEVWYADLDPTSGGITATIKLADEQPFPNSVAGQYDANNNPTVSWDQGNLRALSPGFFDVVSNGIGNKLKRTSGVWALTPTLFNEADRDDWHAQRFQDNRTLPFENPNPARVFIPVEREDLGYWRAWRQQVFQGSVVDNRKQSLTPDMTIDLTAISIPPTPAKAASFDFFGAAYWYAQNRIYRALKTTSTQGTGALPYEWILVSLDDGSTWSAFQTAQRSFRAFYGPTVEWRGST